MTEAAELYDLYCEWRAQTYNWQRALAQHPMRSGSPSPERLALVERMIAWCRVRHLDPGRWLYSVFAARRWMFAPTLVQLTPGDSKSAGQIRKLAAWKIYHQEGATPLWSAYLRRQQRQRQQEAGAVFDPNRDLNSTVELVKQRYADRGQAQRCFDELTTMFGYHPKSAVCRACPLRFACADRLEPAVIQLRSRQPEPPAHAAQ